MTEEASIAATTRYYFVDEAGDPTIFDQRGRSLIGKEGCSKYFILGKLDVANPESLSTELNDLRLRLMADPYFKGVPSMQPEQGKTAVFFHAKDDVAEVRREVFSLLLRHDVNFYAVVREKNTILQKVKTHQVIKPNYRYHPNQLYDRCVSDLFKERLHKDAGYSIAFARRGKSDRTEALKKALEAARLAFRDRWGVMGNAPIEIVPSNPSEVICLQAADYFLWALQRFYERDEDRFLHLIWPKTKLVLDVDDTRDKGYGAYYNQAKPLSLALRKK